MCVDGDLAMEKLLVVREAQKLKLVIIAIATLASGCSMAPVVSRIGDGAPRALSVGSAVGEPAFALDVSRSGRAGPQETVMGNWHLRGFYTGVDRDCSAVSVHNLSLGRTTHYRVCGNDVRERNEVAPEFPRGEGAERVRRSTIEGAWRYGQAAQRWEVYTVNSQRVGPPRADGCATVTTVVTYEGMLVRYDEERVCH